MYKLFVKIHELNKYIYKLFVKIQDYYKKKIIKKMNVFEKSMYICSVKIILLIF